jgi:hypothetical protein
MINASYLRGDTSVEVRMTDMIYLLMRGSVRMRDDVANGIRRPTGEVHFETALAINQLAAATGALRGEEPRSLSLKAGIWRIVATRNTTPDAISARPNAFESKAKRMTPTMPRTRVNTESH